MMKHLQNPLREGLRLQRTPESCALVIFGASGDLTRRKLVPALYNPDLSRCYFCCLRLSGAMVCCFLCELSANMREGLFV